MIKTINGPGLRLVLDSSEIFPDDPGQGTPAMVYIGLRNSATFWWAIGEGEVEDKQLNSTQHNWLLAQENVVVEFLNAHGG